MASESAQQTGGGGGFTVAKLRACDGGAAKEGQGREKAGRWSHQSQSSRTGWVRVRGEGASDGLSRKGRLASRKGATRGHKKAWYCDVRKTVYIRGDQGLMLW